jgi:hypothetical protein
VILHPPGAEHIKHGRIWTTYEADYQSPADSRHLLLDLGHSLIRTCRRACTTCWSISSSCTVSSPQAAMSSRSFAMLDIVRRSQNAQVSTWTQNPHNLAQKSSHICVAVGRFDVDHNVRAIRSQR